MLVAAQRTLLLNPSTNLAQPRGWQAIGSQNSPKWISNARYDDIHCTGGGFLLMWLLVKAGIAPKAKKIYVHGPLILPTPTSCAAWLGQAGQSALTCNQYAWSRQAISLGAGGCMSDQGKVWIEPLLLAVAAGRTQELANDVMALYHRWERKGFLLADADDEDWHEFEQGLEVEPAPASGPQDDVANGEKLVVRCAEDACDLVVGA